MATRSIRRQFGSLAAEGMRLETFLCDATMYAHSRSTDDWAIRIPQRLFRYGQPSVQASKWFSQAEIGNHFTHADLMKSRGYTTAQVGKWQLSGKLPTLVRDAGFDEYCMWAYDHNLPEGIKHPAH